MISAVGAAYKARYRAGAGTIHHGQACGKYMATILEHSVYVFNIMVVKFNVNTACYTLHFVTINECVCTKPLQYHIYGLFLLSPDRARPLRRTARLHPPGNFVTPAVFGMITIRN